MIFDVNCGGTIVSLKIDQERCLEGVSPEVSDEVSRALADVITPVITMLARMYNAADTPLKIAALSLLIISSFGEVLPRVITHLQRLELGLETVDDVIDEINQREVEVGTAPDDDPMGQAINDLDLSDL